MARLLLVCSLVMACGRPAAPASAVNGVPTGSASAPVDPVPQPVPDPVPPAPTPASLYADCKDRVEGVGAAGECKTDVDCNRAGCGSEVCTTVAAAKEVTSTCEDKLCFKVLDTCGCHEGECTWTLKSEVPTPVPGSGRLPPTLPPTGAPAGS